MVFDVGVLFFVLVGQLSFGGFVISLFGFIGSGNVYGDVFVKVGEVFGGQIDKYNRNKCEVVRMLM